MNSEPDLGCCCGCDTEIDVINILSLPFRLPEVHRSGYGAWLCVVCDLPAEGAIAVVCDTCLATDTYRWFVIGNPADNKRGLVSSLYQKFVHDMSKHR